MVRSGLITTEVKWHPWIMAESEETTEDGLEVARMVAGNLIGRTPKLRSKTLSGRLGRRRSRSDAEQDADSLGTIDESLAKLVAEQGWEKDLRVHGAFARWAAIMGREVAAHSTPESLVEGKLHIRTDTTAWATQLRLMSTDIVRRLNEVLGEGTVLEVDVRGPNAPSWKRGRLSVKGRGPRDTYG